MHGRSSNLPLSHWCTLHINGLVKERRNSIANALELRLSCTNPSICFHSFHFRWLLDTGLAADWEMEYGRWINRSGANWWILGKWCITHFCIVCNFLCSNSSKWFVLSEIHFSFIEALGWLSVNCVIIGPGNGLSPVWCQATTYTLSIGPSRPNSTEILIQIHTRYFFMKIHFNMSSVKY